MELFGIYEILKAYCSTRNIFFIPGSDAYVNAVNDSDTYENYDKLLIADFTASPKFVGGRVVSTVYSGILALGQKRELTDIDLGSPEVLIQTESNLDETFEQKYDRRLKDTAQALAIIIGDIMCANELEVTNARFKLDINKFDLNIDMVAATITFED